MSTPRRSLLPREHGAYGQLLAPLAAALAVGRPGLASLGLAAAAVLAFLAHEPLLVALGQRGQRAREEAGARARRLLCALGTAGLLLGTAGLWAAPAPARWAAAAVLPLLAASAILVLLEREKTAIGEVLVAATLAAAAVPVALAGGVSPAVALACFAVFTLAFASATVAVHVLLWRAHHPEAADPGPWAVLLIAAFGGLAVGLAALGSLPWAAPLALLPMAVPSLFLAAIRVSPRRLRQVGWTIAAASLATVVALAATLR